mmetsp:Transcript_28440/g.29606  ORF Transcript_28440/g.29606 Transcript_28440/m.29606 type:complete len:85 (-) Transcript_28440:66-320(-)
MEKSAKTNNTKKGNTGVKNLGGNTFLEKPKTVTKSTNKSGTKNTTTKTTTESKFPGTGTSVGGTVDFQTAKANLDGMIDIYGQL